MEQKRARGEESQRFLQLEEEELKQSEGQFRLLTDAIPQIVWTALPDGKVDYYNQRWYDFTGYTRKESFQHEWWVNILHPDDRPRSLETWHRAIQTGERYEVEYRLWDKSNGEYRWFLTRALPVYDHQGKIIKWFGTSTDINDRKQAEEKLLFHASLAQNISDAVIVTDMESKIISWNSAAESLYGWKAEEVQGKLLYKVLQTQYPTAAREEWLNMVIANNYWRGEVRHLRRDGAWLDIQVGVSIVRDLEGKIIGMVEIARDITEQKMAEQRKDTFIGMASHELKTPLTTIKGFAQLLKRQMKRLGLEEQATILTKIEGQINALTGLVNELMDVSKIQAGKLEYTRDVVDIDELIRSVAEMLQQTSNQHMIKVSGKTQRKLVGDQARLEQVFTNLITNAIKYSPQANRVDIWIGNAQDRIIVKIRDYGIGMPPEEVERIFERFYRANTAKNQGIGGLGMGLYISREIVERHGGKILVESKEGEGSTFCVELPFSPISEEETFSGDSNDYDHSTNDK